MTLPAMRTTGTTLGREGQGNTLFVCTARTSPAAYSHPEPGYQRDWQCSGLQPRHRSTPALGKGREQATLVVAIGNAPNETSLKTFAGLLADALQKETICDADLRFYRFCSRLLA
ncbi:MAG: hypothetical protein KatS3mg056_2527 [Chloroflexus sp.]|nr:MAG: hypothetical protein KatS3mg056_2527 [Chloroflexus sp.]